MSDPKKQNLFLALTAALSLRQKIFLSFCAALLSWNFISLGQTLWHNHQARKANPYIFLGYKYLGLNEIIVGPKRIGYLTDKNMDDRGNAMEFAQAEYALAPITLDLNNPAHEYVILNFASPVAAIANIKKLGLIIWKQNQLGVLVARNPRAQGQ